ncbi:fibronectin type III domain-containing protein [Aequorivita sediminis]|uniref:fibronectin type III domain-containing protein n=1 Tax=Aequorivita sediminis TaxID=3073653 RepID=UPI0028AD79C2|nr:T9SS type A sorting domain-containing protein [Aequorivita sp. F6058]
MKYTLSLSFLLLLFLTPILGNSQNNCSPHDHPANDIRSKGFMDAGGQTIANDFQLSANTTNFSLEQIEANLWTEDGEIASIDVVFFNNDNGHPGLVLGDTISNVVPTSQIVIDQEEDFDIRRVVLDLPQAIDFEGTGTEPVKYWIQLIAHASILGKRVGWEINGVEVEGEGVNYSNPAINYWLVNETWDGVFTLNGVCTLAEGCLIPENVAASNIETNQATIVWNGWPEAESYTVEYGFSGFTPGTGNGVEVSVPSSTTEVILDNLELITSYDVYIKTVCNEGESIFTIPFNFTTNDFYCQVGNLDTIEPISNVEFAGIENRSPAALDEAPAHEYFLDISAQVVPGESYEIIVEGNTGGNYQDGVSLFIDWNQDNTFNNTTERYDIGILENSNGEDGIQISKIVEVPTNALAGITRMRLVKEFYANMYPIDGCTWVTYGQVEDYAIQVGTLSTNSIETNSFSIYPNPVSNVLNITSQHPITKMEIYSIMGQKVFEQTIDATRTEVDVNKFSPGMYFVKIEAEGITRTQKFLKK